MVSYSIVAPPHQAMASAGDATALAPACTVTGHQIAALVLDMRAAAYEDICRVNTRACCAHVSISEFLFR